MSETVEHEAAPPNRRLGVIFLALVVLALLLGVRWWYGTTVALNQVFVVVSSPACTGTTVGAAEVGDAAVAAPQVVPGMRCEVTVNVANPGTVPVTLSSITLPGLGPASDLPVQATEAEDRNPSADSDDEDASYDVEERIDPGGFLDVTVAYEFRDGGCLADETFSATNWPNAQVTMSKRTKTVAAERDFALRATDESTC
jgi:hypothetical protein